MSGRLVVFLTSVTFASTPAWGQQAFRFVSPPAIDLPFGDASFPDGKGAKAINDNCLACHSADHVLNQPSLSREGWEEVVKKMVRAYKAPIDPEDQKQIVDYLAPTKGLD